MSKYKVGDRVKVRSDLEYGKVYGLDYATSVMAEFSGKVVTIETLLIIGKYRVKECGYNWTDEMFSGLAEGPACATEADTLDSIADILQDYKDSGRLTELDALHAINMRLSEHYIGYGVEPPDITRCIPDDSPDDADVATFQEPEELKVGDYVRVTEQWSSYHREVGRVSYIPELSGGYCNVKFSDETCTALDFTHLEKLRDDEPIPHITLTERPEIVLQEDIEPDAVNHPAHYTQYSVEVMDTIEEVAAHYPATVAYHIGAAIKYIFRAPFKGKLVEDLKKSAYYINRAINILEDTQ